MKHTFRILSTAFLTAVYFYAIGVVTTSIAPSEVLPYQTTSQETFAAGFSSKLFIHTSPSASSVSNFNHPPVQNFKTSTPGFWAIIKAIEQLFESEFSHYASVSGNILVSFTKSDIIFPFHYFW